ncbi:MAG: OmpA family protein, partial [Paracoccaceae bacterium]|nr:OmpA family protein [Paracoccaceae bacterium]
TLGEKDVRRSDQNAPDRTAPQVSQSGAGLSDLEKFGLLALGAVAVGAILSNGQTVVSNSGDRVVVREPDGRYGVMHDDNALVRRPGSTVYTRNYNDGSVLSRVVLADGTVIITVLDADGRVLRRSVQHPDERPVMLYDDTRPERVFVPDSIPREAPVIITYDRQTTPEALVQGFETRPPHAYARTFSLRQVRDLREVRNLVPAINLSALTFDTGSSAIQPEQAQALADLGSAMARLIARNPSEVFLIEGHTDAVGDVASNLALSDARAESVALALTEGFGVPPENMVTQGYGKSDLAVQTEGPSQANRRVVVRRITSLLEPVAAN